MTLYIDSDLKFTKHVIKKSDNNVNLICSSRSMLSDKIKQILCYSLVLLHTNYGDVVYDLCLVAYHTKMRFLFGKTQNPIYVSKISFILGILYNCQRFCT